MELPGQKSTACHHKECVVGNLDRSRFIQYKVVVKNQDKFVVDQN